MTSVTEIAAELVRIPSINPDSEDPGFHCTGEMDCAQRVFEFLEDAGADASLREVAPGRPNVVARFPSKTPNAPRVLFAPHLDTVSVSGMTIPPFDGTIRDGCLWGRGASDTKGPMASMLWSLLDCRDFLTDLPVEIWFAGLVGEEAGQIGAKALADQERFDFVIAGEPTSLQVVHAHKGSCWLHLKTRGHAVHASRPETGDNAIYKMATAIDTLRNRVAPRLSEKTDSLLGGSTLSVGTIRGGSKVNIVPDFCEAHVDIRTIPGIDPSFITAMLQESVPDISVTLHRSEPLYTDPSNPFIKKLQALGAGLAGAPWFCDAAVFASKGCPAVAIGPGSINQAHTADEFIAINDLEEGAAFFSRFLQSLRLA
jgi:acetylornithine deacetylase/succinyl-diaminopimelate desuccinylase-like protein